MTALVVLADALVVAIGTAAGGWISSAHLGVPAMPNAWGIAGLLTLLSLWVWRAWEPQSLGQGSEEFSSVLRGTITSLVLLGLFGLVFELSSVRPWAFAFIPLIGLAVAATRYVLSRGLHRRRFAGQCMHRVLAVGTPQSIAELVVRTRDNPHFGWDVAGACTASGRGLDGDAVIAGVPVVGDLEALHRVVEDGHYRVVAVTPPDWSLRRLRRLSW